VKVIKSFEEDESTDFYNLQNAGLAIVIVRHAFIALQCAFYSPGFVPQQVARGRQRDLRKHFSGMAVMFIMARKHLE
jgi:hypothetical protein